MFNSDHFASLRPARSAATTCSLQQTSTSSCNSPTAPPLSNHPSHLIQTALVAILSSRHSPMCSLRPSHRRADRQRRLPALPSPLLHLPPLRRSPRVRGILPGTRHRAQRTTGTYRCARRWDISSTRGRGKARRDGAGRWRSLPALLLPSGFPRTVLPALPQL